MAKSTIKAAVKAVVAAVSDKAHPDSKVTLKDVRAIRDAHKKGVSIFEIADMADMNAVMARDIALGRMFK